MPAKKISWLEKGKRRYLKELLPLDIPLSINIEATNLCNLKCRYCLHSVAGIKGKFKDKLPLKMLEKIIDEFQQANVKIKAILFTGGGEPLLHKDLAEMIRLAKRVAEDVSIITNGLLLTPEKSIELIEAGTDYIRISLQGITSQEYHENSGVEIDFDKFYRNIKYLFSHKNKCEIHLKFSSIDRDEEKEEKIFTIFGNFCDAISFQNIVHFFDKVEFTRDIASSNRTIFGQKSEAEAVVCPQPFYTMQILSNGGIIPCCHLEARDLLLFGNAKDNKILDVWRGERMRKLRNAHLKNQKANFPICQDCKFHKYTDNKYDNIDDIKDELFEKINK